MISNVFVIYQDILTIQLHFISIFALYSYYKVKFLPRSLFFSNKIVLIFYFQNDSKIFEKQNGSIVSIIS